MSMILTESHFQRALRDIVAYGDNDMLPFDVDTRFLDDCREELVQSLLAFARILEAKPARECKSELHRLTIFSERLLAPAGATGFRTTTKIHPLWNLYCNALAVAVAERHEPKREDRAHSYRFSDAGDSLFNRERSWRVFREGTLADCDEAPSTGVVVQTDVAGFYERVYHHRLENYLVDVFGEDTNIPMQLDVLLNKLAGGRSFGIPVGGQCSRILAEVLMGSVDRVLTTSGLRWRRYVDDFTIVADNQSDAYRALSVLARALDALGLGLNRTKTTILSVRHFRQYVTAQLGSHDDESRELREVDLYFDPYSATPEADYERLKATVDEIDLDQLLSSELAKARPDRFLVSQITRSLRLAEAPAAIAVCSTLLAEGNLHSFRANWSGILRGVATIRGLAEFECVHARLDELLDAVPNHSPHLLQVDSNVLHYLRAIRFHRTAARASLVHALYESKLVTVRRACIDCWRAWTDRDQFLAVRRNWEQLVPDEQRMLWLAASAFGDDGKFFRKQVRTTLEERWKLGVERRSTASFAKLYSEWACVDDT